MEYANFMTPIEGIVTHVIPICRCQYLLPPEQNSILLTQKQYYFSATADQTDVINLKEGMTGDVNFDAYPDKNFIGTLYYMVLHQKPVWDGTVYEVRFKLDAGAMESGL